MGGHEMAYQMAYTDVTRRDYGTGSVFQRCETRFGCPSIVDGERPKHDCKGRWFGVIEAGFTASGSRRRISVSAKSKPAAQRKLRDKRVELDQAGRAGAKRTVTVAKWAAEWLTSIESTVRPASYEADKAAVRWIVRTIGHVKIADLTPAHVRQVAAAIRAAGLSTSTALRYHGPLMRMLKAAAHEGYNVPPNVLLADQPKKAVNDRQALPVADILTMFAHLTSTGGDGSPVVPDSSRWTIAFLQGIRQGEALGLTWDSVTDDTLTISWQAQSLRYRDKDDPSKGFRIPDGYEVRHLVGATHLVRPKSRAGWRPIPLVPWAAQALEQWREVAPENEHGLVWPGRTTRAGTWPRNAAGDRARWDELQEAAGVAHPSGRRYEVHEIRHSTATLLMELRVPESVRIAIMGHSSITTTHGYEHVDVTQARAALEQLAGRLQL